MHTLEREHGNFPLFYFRGLGIVILTILWYTRSIWQSIPKRNASQGLVKLPLEVWIDILKLLDWEDVIALRQTCRTLSDVSRAKPVWMHLFNASNASHPYSPLRLERPMELYNAQELEYLVLRRSSAEIIRKSRNELLPSLTRLLPYGDIIFGDLLLITGGRWLLTYSNYGSVFYYDLDSREPMCRPLIAEQLGPLPPWRNSVIMAVDMDTDSSVLSFKLAMVIARHGPCFTNETQIIQVWQIKLHVDNDSHVASLSSTLLSCFPREDYGHVLCFTILGKNVAFGIGHEESAKLPLYVAVVDWEQADVHTLQQPASLSYQRKVIFFRTFPIDLRLLPGGRVLVVAETFVAIYDTSQLELTRIPPVFETYTLVKYPSPHWAYNLRYIIAGSLSQPFFSRHTNTFRFTLFTESAVHGLIIPESTPIEEPTHVELMNMHIQDGYAFSSSYNSAIVHSGTPCLHMLNFLWSEDVLPQSSNHLRVEFSQDNWMTYISAFDEGSGRTVVCSRSYIVVCDFSRFIDLN